jgi:hypothetical protein
MGLVFSVICTSNTLDNDGNVFQFNDQRNDRNVVVIHASLYC